MKRIASLHLVIALALSLLLVVSNAVPSSRSIGMFQEKRGVISISEDPEAISNDASVEERMIRGRMDIAVNDYPPSGANNRHTPKPPGNT